MHLLLYEEARRKVLLEKISSCNVLVYMFQRSISYKRVSLFNMIKNIFKKKSHLVFLSLTGCDYINDDDIRNALFPQLCYILLILHGIHGLVYLQKISYVIYVKLD